MRRVALLVLLAGCPLSTGPSTGECETDGDCLGNTCARDGFCYPEASIREVRTTWTIRGAAASVTSCGTTRDLHISFAGGDAGEVPLGYAPVPCETGQFFIDKLPRLYTIVELGRDGGFADSKSIGATGTVEFDLRF
jgi:hypothetical protein